MKYNDRQRKNKTLNNEMIKIIITIIMKHTKNKINKDDNNNTNNNINKKTTKDVRTKMGDYSCPSLHITENQG